MIYLKEFFFYRKCFVFGEDTNVNKRSISIFNSPRTSSPWPLSEVVDYFFPAT